MSAHVGALALVPLALSALLVSAECRAWEGGPRVPKKKGIGVYADTQGAPPVGEQMATAAELVGEGGAVVLFLTDCLGRKPDVAGFGETLQMAYARYLRVVVRLGWKGAMRNFADGGSNRTSYANAAAKLADVVAALPLPPSDQPPLLVHAGNELNACNEWRCTEPSDVVLGEDTRAAEVAGFMRDTLAALKALPAAKSGRLLPAHASMANWHHAKCVCRTNAPTGVGRPGTEFIQRLLDIEPHLYDGATWLSSHSYPYANADYGTAKSENGLTYHRRENAVVRPNGPPLPVVITETGWARNGVNNRVTAEHQAAWLQRAGEDLWASDDTVLYVCPFLLAGSFWEVKGWTFVACGVGGNGSAVCGGPYRRMPVYDAWYNTTL